MDDAKEKPYGELGWECRLARVGAGLISAVLFGLVCSACGVHESNKRIPSTVQGRVLDKTSGKPVASAIVEWSANDHKQAGSTDSNGGFSFLIPMGRDSKTRGGDQGAAKEIILTTTANLYRRYEMRVQARPGETTWVDIRLDPKAAAEIGMVAGTLINSDNGRGIKGATVSIVGAGAELTATTGPDGAFNIGGVGFSPNLKIRITTRLPPCVAPIVKPLVMDRAVVNLGKIGAPTIKLPVLRCP
jgi:hypothetical protein